MKTRSLIIAALILISAIVIFNSSIAKADVHVHDKNNQYLGVLLEASSDYIMLFIPSLNLPYYLGQEMQGLAFGGYDSTTNYYESSDCSGTPYASNPSFAGSELFPNLYRQIGCLGGYYAAGLSGRTEIVPGSSSSYDGDQCTCSQIDIGSIIAYPLTLVQMPFTEPIAFPLRYEYTSGGANKAVVIPLF